MSGTKKMKNMFLIAEIGQAHEGSLGIAHSYIDALAETGVDAIKFQTHIADAESSEQEPFRVKFSYEDDKRIDYWRRMEFSLEQWKGLKDHCEEKGLEFISSPFSCAAVDLLEKIGVNKYKIGSGEVSNFLMLEKIARTGKPILLSSGMSSFSELEKTIDFLKSFDNEINLLQCTTAYPTQPEEWGLNVIQELKDRFQLPVGFSDHSGDIFAGLSAVTLGAELIEFHVVFDKRMFGPDARASLTIEQTKRLAEGVQQIQKANVSGIDKSDNSSFLGLKKIFEKSLAVNKALPEGHTILFEDLEAKKPSHLGIPANQFQRIVGRQLKVAKDQWDFLKEEDLHEA